MKKVISTRDAPSPVGPYAQAIRVGTTVYCAGQIPLNPKTGELISQEIAEQTKQVLENLCAVLASEELGARHIVKTTVFLAEMADYPIMNEVYGRYFAEQPPARTTVQAAGLPRGARIEIDAIAVEE